MNDHILSVGIDIGTTTTSMIVSRLGIANTAASYMVPDIDITTKDILYRSKLYITPLFDRETLDGEKIRGIIESEYRSAGIRPMQVDTGAVIITGEASLKENAEIILQNLSSFAGEFVVATAGPDLESIIAGRGSGAEEFSKKYGCIVANLDIGGGTTNISVFNCGDLEAQTCIDVGGRLIKYDEQRCITYVSKRFQDLAALRNLRLTEGMKMREEDLWRAGNLLADVILDSIHEEHFSLTEAATTHTSLPIHMTDPIQYISFSGGVADCYYSGETNLYKFNDLGVVIARALQEKVKKESFEVIRPKETIRATVVGAGTYMAEVSGSTIAYNDNIFPIKNLPMYVVSREAEEAMYQGDAEPVKKGLVWYMDQMREERIGICIKGKDKMSYGELCNLAISLIRADEKIIPDKYPLVLVCENDMAKALGQVIERQMKKKKSVICLDSIRVRSGDYIDIGKPVMDGVAVPVVVKTLIFN